MSLGSPDFLGLCSKDQILLVTSSDPAVDFNYLINSLLEFDLKITPIFLTLSPNTVN